MNQPVLNPPQVSLYAEKIMLRILFEYDGMRKFLCNHRVWVSDKIAQDLGIPLEWEDEEDAKAIQARIRQLLSARHRQLIDTPLPTTIAGWETAYTNLTVLAENLQLNAAETEILRMALHMNAEKAMEQTFRYVSEVNYRNIISILSELLNLPRDAVRLALHSQGKLFGFGLLEQAHQRSEELDDYLRWDDAIDLNDFCLSPWDDKKLLSQCVSPTKTPSLHWDDFAHIASMQELMLHYLRTAQEHNKVGVNILIYGAPGTGKTEFAALLAQQLGVNGYTLGFSDKDGDVLRAERRLEHARLGQTLLAEQPTLLIFDEIEDIFSGSPFERSVAQEHKAWINQLLEQNPVPMVWISNNVRCMDEAFIRRFDLVLEMPDLPNSHKEKLIRDLVGDKLNQDYVHYFAQQSHLTAAMLTRGLEVIQTLPNHNTSFAERALQVFNQTLQAQGKPKLIKLADNKVEYSLEWINCRNNVAHISQGLSTYKQGRICCYGPPGTGKTAWATWLAKQAELPLLLKHGSDLLGMYVGETEKNIAAAFQQAKENNMMLVLDEVDSFLFPRGGSDKSWERSMVNEMLTQIEQFEGLLVVSTNLMHNLDQAALRRFDVKLHFDFLSSSQIRGLAQAQAAKLNLPPLSDNQLQQICSLRNLTPGDFAALTRQHRFAAFQDTKSWINALIEECNLKPDRINSIGFF